MTELTHHRGDVMLELADLYMRRDKHGHYSNSTDARVAVNCVDQPPVKDRAKVIDEDRRSREVAPFMNYGKFTGDAPLGTCAFWPVPPTSKPHAISASGLTPTLVVSTTHDPATPYQAGVDLANELRAGCSPSTAPSTRWSSRATAASTTMRRPTCSPGPCRQKGAKC